MNECILRMEFSDHYVASASLVMYHHGPSAILRKSADKIYKILKICINKKYIPIQKHSHILCT